MANLWLTSECERKCEYCFVGDMLEGDVSSDSEILALTDLDQVLEWCVPAGSSPGPGREINIQLMGGEPLHHPDLVEIVKRVEDDRRFNLKTLLTNALGETERLADIKALAPGMDFVVNVNHPDTYTEAEWDLLETNLGVLTEDVKDQRPSPQNFRKLVRVQLAITFYQPEQRFRYLIDLAREFGVFFIRYAPSHPSPTLKNEHVDFEKLKEIKPVLLDFIRTTVQEGLSPTLECILPPCVFTTGEWFYMQYVSNDVKSVCQNHLDVMPDLSVAYCGSMTQHINRYQIQEFSLEEIRRRQGREANRLKSMQLPRCEGCDFFEDRNCQGYCLRYKKEILEEQ